MLLPCYPVLPHPTQSYRSYPSYPVCEDEVGKVGWAGSGSVSSYTGSELAGCVTCLGTSSENWPPKACMTVHKHHTHVAISVLDALSYHTNTEIWGRMG